MSQNFSEARASLKSFFSRDRRDDIAALLRIRKPTSVEEFRVLDPELYRSSPILVVDDEVKIRSNLRQMLEPWGCIVLEAADGKEALQVISENPIRLVLSDVDMPNMDGLELLSRISKEHQSVSVIIISGMGNERVIDEALARGAIGYIQKPFRLPELKSQVTYALRTLKLATDSIESQSIISAFESTSGAEQFSSREFARLFVMTSDLHHIETGSHIRRIGRFSKLLAKLISLPEQFAENLGEAAVLHDIGKLAIPDAILKKPAPLTAEEFEVMKTHPVLGGQILQGSSDPLLRLAHAVTLYHHERWDGSGYPSRFKGTECPIEARIVGVVDVFDALTEKRVYKEAWSRDRVEQFFSEKRGVLFEPRLVDALLSNYAQFEAIRVSE